MTNHQPVILTFDVNNTNVWLKSKLQPASEWGVSVGVSVFGLSMLVTLFVVFLRAKY